MTRSPASTAFLRPFRYAPRTEEGGGGVALLTWRWEHIIVDTLGLPLAVAIHEANLHDSKGAPQAIEKLAYKFPRLVKILADGGYRGDLADWVKKKFGWILEVVLRPDECPSKFQVLPKRWIVERSFSWLKISEGRQSITKSLLKPQKLWYRLHSYKSCLTNLSNEIKTAS